MTFDFSGKEIDEGGLHYVGGGSFLPHVPARDLKADEVEQLGGAEKLQATGLYVSPMPASKPDRRSKDKAGDSAGTPKEK